MLSRRVKTRIRRNAMRRRRWADPYCRGEDKVVMTYLADASKGKLGMAFKRFYAVWSSLYQDHPGAQPLSFPGALQFGSMHYKPELKTTLELSGGKTKELVVSPSYYHDTGQLLREVTKVRKAYARAHAA